MTFATLKADLLAVIGRAPASVCYTLVTADLNRDLRVRQMEATATLTEAPSVTLPADFLEVIDLYRNTSPRRVIMPSTVTQQSAGHVASGTPQTYAISGDTLTLNPEPNGSEDLVLRYFARLADLVDDADTNDVMATYPGLYVYGALAHHAAMIRDEKAAVMWQAKYQAELRAANAKGASSKYGSITPTARVVA